MKGIEILTLALIGLIAVSAVLFWSMTQIGISQQGIVISREISEADKAISEIEGSKRTLKDSLVFSSNIASLQIALAGGSYGNERVWWCNGNPTPPETTEVLWSLSNKTGALLQVYINKAEKLLEANITGYECIEINYPQECRRYPCILWNASAIDGSVSYFGRNIKIVYDGNIETDTKPNRFWWMYFTLYNFVKQKPLDIKIPGCVPGDDTTILRSETDKFLRQLIIDLERRFDGFVDCDYEYDCGQADTQPQLPQPQIPGLPGITPKALPQCKTECPRQFNEQLCYKPESKYASFQAQSTTPTTTETETVPTKIAIKCTDQKYRIPDEKKFKELTWIIKAGIVVNYEKCPTTTLPPTTAPPATHPPATTPVTHPPGTTPATSPPGTIPPPTQPPPTQPPPTQPPTTQPPPPPPPTAPGV